MGETMSDNFSWWNPTASTTDANFTGTITFSGIFEIKKPKPIDKNWMPYDFFEYDPLWHKKFARYKMQMETMWD